MADDDLRDRIRAVINEAIDRMAETFVAESRLKSMDFRNGVNMEMEPARELAANFVAAARTMLSDAENYSETPIEMTMKLAGEVERYAFVVQRVGKLTPHQARMLAEERADEAEAQHGIALSAVALWRGRAERAEAALARILSLKVILDDDRAADGITPDSIRTYLAAHGWERLDGADVAERWQNDELTALVPLRPAATDYGRRVRLLIADIGWVEERSRLGVMLDLAGAGLHESFRPAGGVTVDADDLVTLLGQTTHHQHRGPGEKGAEESSCS